MPVCTRCGFETVGGSGRCPLCGSDLADGPPPGEAVAWEDPRIPFPLDLLTTWRQSVLEAARFFPRLRYGAGLARPLLYYLLVYVVAAFFGLWWDTLGVAAGWRAAVGPPGVDRGTAALLEFFAMPFLALLGLGLGTLVLHFFALLLAPERRGLGDTARVLCYAAGPAVLNIVPVVGPVVGFLWTLVLQVIGIRAAHRTTTGRAAAIVLLPLALALLLVLFWVFVAVLIGGAALLDVLRTAP